MPLITLEWKETRGDRHRTYGLELLPDSILQNDPLRIFLLDRTPRHFGEAEELALRRAVLDIDLRIPVETLGLPRELCDDARLLPYDATRDAAAEWHCVFHNDRFARYLRDLAGAAKVIPYSTATPSERRPATAPLRIAKRK